MTDPLDPVRDVLSRAETVDPDGVPLARQNSPDLDPGPAPPDDAWMPDSNGFRGPPPSGEADLPPEAEAARLPLNDIGNGRRFATYFGPDVMSVPRVGWYTWAGTHWAKDPDKLAVRAMAQTISERILGEIPFLVLEPWERRALDELPGARAEVMRLEAITDRSEDEKAALAKAVAQVRKGEDVKKYADKRKGDHRTFAKSTGNTGKIDAMLTEAAVGLSQPVDAIDADDLAVNTLSGTLRFSVDRGGAEDGATPVAQFSLDPHERADRLTKCMPVIYNPEAKAPLFEAFLQRIQPSADRRAFLQRSFGLAMTGFVEQRIWFFYGHGANGKSVLVDLMAKMLGDYAATAKIESLTGQSKRGGADATPDLVPLMGARMVRASEPEQGERLKEGTIKELTGGEPILVRALHSDFVEVKPEFKLFISGNHKPEIRGTDDGIWRRVLLVLFDVQIPEAERDPELGRKLLAEGPGILNWMIEGLLSYLEMGLQVPADVQAATQEYREESDPIGVFLDACCEVTGAPDAFTRSKDLIDAFNFWLEDNGESQWRGRTVALRLKDKAEKWRDPRTGLTFTTSKRSVSGYQGLVLTDLFRRRWDDAIAAGRWKTHAPSGSTSAPDPDIEF